MKRWIPAMVLAAAFVGLGAYALGPLRPVGSPNVVKAAPEEDVAGTKRTPGTYKQPTINVGREDLGEPEVTVDIDVMRPVFIPFEVKVKQGQVVKLRLHGKDNGLADDPAVQGAIALGEFSGHGFQILGPYDVWVTGIRKDVTREVVFKASVAGEFPFECVVFCSPNHYKMQGKLTVEPQ